MIETILAAIENDDQRNELADFYQQYKKRFFNIAFSKLNSSNDAEDVVQETFVRIADNPDKFFAIPKQERAYFTDGIVRHIAIDRFNEKNKNNTVSVTDLLCDLPDNSISPEEKYITDKSAEEIAQFVLTIPENQRIVLYMYVHEKLSYSEISKILNISEELARKRISNARKAIKSFVEENK